MNNYTAFTYEEVQKALNTPGLTFVEALEKINKQKLTEAQAKIDKQNKYRELLQTDISGMSKQEIIELTWKLPELPVNMYQLIKDCQGFLTGSSVISNISTATDEDWCVTLPPHVFSEYSLGQTDQGYWEADGFSSLYCHHNGTLINILCFSDSQLYSAWEATTVLMASLKDQFVPIASLSYRPNEIQLSDIFATKWKRVTLFRALRDVFYEPYLKRNTPLDDAWKYSKCKECSREAIYFTCKAAKQHYQNTGVCERCSGITY